MRGHTPPVLTNHDVLKTRSRDEGRRSLANQLLLELNLFLHCCSAHTAPLSLPPPLCLNDTMTKHASIPMQRPLATALDIFNLVKYIRTFERCPLLYSTQTRIDKLSWQEDLRHVAPAAGTTGTSSRVHECHDTFSTSETANEFLARTFVA
jgi:hypothetical protein